MRIKMRFLWVVLILCTTINIHAQDFSWIEPEDKKAIDRIENTIAVLASDSLLGREAGTKGEIMAADFIIENFKQAGLHPGFQGKWRQAFDFINGISYGDNNSFQVGKSELSFEKDYYPLFYSSNGKIEGKTVYVHYGLELSDQDYSDYKKFKTEQLKGKVFVIEIGYPEDISIDKKKPSLLEEKIATAIEKDAKGVIFIMSDNTQQAPEKELFTYPDKKIPVIFFKNHDETPIKKEVYVEISTDIVVDRLDSYNIVGRINNKAEKTIIIGAHYDHLGMGEFGSRYFGEPAVHNGADDNASGVASMIELAGMLKKTNNTCYNYIFIAFSAEEKGLIGAQFYANSPEFDAENVLCMLNIDMLGRIDSTNKTLMAIGSGSAEEWDTLLSITPSTYIKVKPSDRISGGSDHFPFYQKETPVLFFFSGMHEDYHKPTDDIEFLNFAGLYAGTKFIYNLINTLCSSDIPLTYVKKQSNSSRQRFKGVTLGIMPDHTFQGKGLRVGAVTSEEKPAYKAGIQKDDVIIQIGEYPINEIQTYMKALGNFNKGDKVDIIIIREEVQMEMQVEF